jgi:hypothetical protein
MRPYPSPAPLCRACGRPFVRGSGRGRPRRYCASCTPAGATHRDYLTAWRLANPASVATSNAQRRERYRLAGSELA